MHALARLIAPLGIATVAATGLAAPATADDGSSDTSLAEVLAADGNTFDRDKKDFDALDRVVRRVLAAKPDSPVGLLADGTVTLTAFIPNDMAFRRLARDVVDPEAGRTERRAVKALVGAVDVDTLETVLLYHVVAGQRLDSAAVAAADGQAIETAQGGEIVVEVGERIFLSDLDPTDADPRVVAVDINGDAHQIAHAINRVLRPADL